MTVRFWRRKPWRPHVRIGSVEGRRSAPKRLRDYKSGDDIRKREHR